MEEHSNFEGSSGNSQEQACHLDEHSLSSLSAATEIDEEIKLENTPPREVEFNHIPVNDFNEGLPMNEDLPMALAYSVDAPFESLPEA